MKEASQAMDMWTTPQDLRRESRRLRRQWLRAIQADVDRAVTVEDLREALVDLLDWLLEREEERR